MRRALRKMVQRIRYPLLRKRRLVGENHMRVQTKMSLGDQRKKKKR